MGSSGQDSVWAGTFCGFLNVSLRASGAQLGLDISKARLGISKNMTEPFRHSQGVPTDLVLYVRSEDSGHPPSLCVRK